MTWIDTHIHVSDLGPDGSRRERFLADLLDVLDRSGEDLRFVVSCDGPYFGPMIRDPEAILAGNRFIHELVREAPDRLYGSCTVNPNFLDASLRSMEQCFEEWGFVQLGEMLQYSMNYQMDSEPSERLVRQAVAYGVPVQVHLGTYWVRGTDGSTDGIHQIDDLLGIAERVPEAQYILAHAIGCGPDPSYVPWADMFLDVVQGVCGSWPDNFWVEIRDFQCPALPRTVAEVPTNRLLSGTDWTTRIGPPFQSYGTMFDVAEADNPFPPGVPAFVNFLKQAGATEGDIDLVAAGNARQLYGISR
ncbi:MAG: amidohydrolase family protein [Armatimonadia bacterium]